MRLSWCRRRSGEETTPPWALMALDQTTWVLAKRLRQASQRHWEMSKRCRLHQWGAQFKCPEDVSESSCSAYESGLSSAVDETAADAFEDELAALTDDAGIGEVSASVSAALGDVEDAFDLMAGESGEGGNPLKSVSVLTDDVGIGEEVSASVSAALGDVEDAEAAIIEAVDAQEDIDPIGSADEWAPAQRLMRLPPMPLKTS